MLHDAHCHYHDARLTAVRGEFLPHPDIAGAVVNGTCESDWAEVEALCAAHGHLRPAFGLHPWRVPQRSAGWEKSLTDFLDRHPSATLGETGLDGWVEGHDLEDQRSVFVRQLGMARERGRAITVHCLKAHEPLRQVLQREAAPACGFLLHAYAGAVSLVPWLLERGAHFSFPPYFLHARKAPQREMFRTLPEDRILLETDAPDLVPPPEVNTHPLTGPSGEAVNHPANLALSAQALAELREVSVAHIAAVTEANWKRLFATV